MADYPHLTMRQRTALSVPPLLLRLALAVTFIWAGYAKVFGTFAVTDENRAGLVAAGVIPEGPSIPQTPADPLPEPEPEPEPEPIEEPPADGETDTPTTSPIEPAPSDPDPAEDPVEAPIEDPGEDPIEDPGVASMPEAGQITLVAQSGQPAEVRNYHGLSMIVFRAGNPEPVEVEGEMKTPMPLVPSMFATPPWPTRLALIAAITELAAGGLLLIGLFTRFGGLAVAGVMGAAMWLTQIGPALQSGNTWLGFLPASDPYDPWNVATYSTFLWQLALLAAGLALLFSGPGMLSLDRWIFGKGVVDDED